jgi:hypothetical protein
LEEFPQRLCNERHPRLLPPALLAAAAAGYAEAVDCDLKSFFDQVDHDLLMARVAARVRDKRVLRLISAIASRDSLIGRCLRAGVVLPNGTREPAPRGVPQGGPLSPLLANPAMRDSPRWTGSWRNAACASRATPMIF